MFENIAAPTRSRLEREAISRLFADGQTLFHEHDRPVQLLVITGGRVRLWRSSSAGSVVAIHLMGPGEVPGCVAAFRGIAYPATATATGAARALAWPLDRIRLLLKEDPAFAANALAIVGSRARELLDRLHEVATEKVEQRLARTLIRLCNQIAPDTGELRVSRQELAELTGATLHTVSRIVGRWETLGLVRGGRGRIAVLEREGLLQLAG